jgi:hypothetical protein
MLSRGMLWALLAGAGCQQGPPPPPEFDGDQALAYVRIQLAFGPRIPGTEGHLRTGNWLDSLLRARADTVIVQAWSHRTAQGQDLPLRNLIARFNPSAERRLLFLAHWDTRPRADAAASRDSTAPVPGANDGASGVAVLLGMADALRRTPPTVGVDLLFVDGEDFGTFPDRDVLLGSTYYARNRPAGPAPLYAVLFDMVGDTDLRILQEGYSLTGAPEVVELVWGTAARLGHSAVFVAQQTGGVTDDHRPLQDAGIRAIDVIDFEYGPGNSYHHTPDDTLDKVSARSLKVVGDVGMALIRRER